MGDHLHWLDYQIIFPIDCEGNLMWDHLHWLAYQIIFPSICGLSKTESVYDLGVHFTAPGGRDGLEIDMDWASNLAWTPLLAS